MEKNLNTNPKGNTNTTILKIFFNSGHMGKGNNRGQINAKSPTHITQEPKVIPIIPKNFFKSLPPFLGYTYILTTLFYKVNLFFSTG